jgi:hypothetical protein
VLLYEASRTTQACNFGETSVAVFIKFYFRSGWTVGVVCVPYSGTEGRPSLEIGCALFTCLTLRIAERILIKPLPPA